ncbi:Predicted E3 ubiquitin ligase [Ceraceosorus bombacis]|uniref:RING-type E3 ubiquitin transferase (cysteine targeting) n=1 Tax=Ceraceosorus bombacis TaxID=401625 RepID=A0A0P1BBC7_9BASI|nr:Predicted E3 ubiquitin ligase [Ceraceosorus bombacis]
MADDAGPRPSAARHATSSAGAGAGTGTAAEQGSSSSLEPFWSSALSRASPSITSLRHRLPTLPSPPLRIQRVSQLDAELLDSELTTMLLDPLMSSLSLIAPRLPDSLGPEIRATLELALWRFSILAQSATYGAMLQNLKYRNEWAHRARGLQSTARDAPLAMWQLLLHPILTIGVPYAHARLERDMTGRNFSERSSDDWRRKIWNGMDAWGRLHAALALANFVIFLGDGKYRTLTDRLLGMRLVYAQRTMSRAISFEFLNRQLVWHAFTEFLLFILPLLKPRRLLKRLMRLPTHPWILRVWLLVLPRRVTSFFGLTQDAQTGKPILRLPASLTRSGSKSGKDQSKFASVPRHVCAICYEREEKRQGGIGGVGRDAIRAGIPSSDPLDPSANTLAPSRASANPNASSSQVRPALPRSRSSNSTSTAALRADEPTVSSTGIAYSTCTAHTPYVVPCCGASYCYICIASVLLSEQAGEELEDSAEDAIAATTEARSSSSSSLTPTSPRSPGASSASGSRSPPFNQSAGGGGAFGDSQAHAWSCLRCGEGIRSARRRDGREPVWREAKPSNPTRRSFSSSADDDDEEELDLLR